MSVRSPLPDPRSRIVGRDPEIAALARLVQQERLVTLTGSPGGGKTRLAVEVGRGLELRISGGVRFVELALVGDPVMVPNAVADAIGVTEQPDRQMRDTLIDALDKAEPLLVILDNCEHVLDVVAALAGGLIAHCPSVRLLATSRAPLGLSDEQVHQVQPLTMSAARELFVERATRASTSFCCDTDDHATIETICGRLGGLPLLIELTAAWTRLLSVRDIALRLDDMGQLLANGPRDVPERHADLAHIVDGSLRLLEPADQQLFARLSVFVGGFDFDAAEAVIGRETGLLAGLATLVDHSLVLAGGAGRTPTRYQLLEPLRQHGASVLAAGSAEDMIRRRHADHYLDLARRCEPNGLEGVRPQLPLSRLESERGNLSAALAWARTQPPDLALRLCLASTPLWEFYGPMNEGRIWLDKALAAGTTDDQLRVAAIERAVKLAWRQGDYGRAEELLADGLASAAEFGDPWWLAITEATGALVAMATGDLRRATGLCVASIAGFERQGGEYGLIWVLTTFGWVRYVEGQPAEGYALMQRALEVNLVVNNPTAAAAAHLGMAYGSCLSDDLVRQRDHLEEALAAMRVQGSLELADWLGVAAVLAAREGRRQAALRLAGGAQAHARHTDSRLPESIRRPLHDHIVNAMAEVGPDRAAQLVEDGRQSSWEVLVAQAFEAPPERRQPATGPGGPRPSSPRAEATDQTQPTRATTGRASPVADARHSDDHHRSVLPNPALEDDGAHPAKPATQDQPPDGAATICQWLSEVSVQAVASLVAAGALALIGILWTTMR